MSDNEDEAAETLYKPSFVLIAIDTHPSMFVKGEQTGTTPFKDCVSACYDLANSLLFTQNKRSWSPFGIVLANEDSKATFVDFSDNILESIKVLKEKSELTEDELKSLYERVGPFDLSAFFLLCKKKFKEVKSAFYKRTVIYVTNDDNPVKGDKNQRFAALNEAKNFEPNNVHFEMVTMNESFDYKIFYNELFSVIKSPLVETLIDDQDGLLDKLSSEILVKYHKRNLNFFPVIGDSERFVKVVQKKYISEERLYHNAWVTRDGNPVKKAFVNTPNTMKTYRLMLKGEAPLEFTAEENRELKSNTLPVGYSLAYISKRVTEIGAVFTGLKMLEIDPEEDPLFFNSFWQFCQNEDRVMICVRKLRAIDKIRYVELIPKFMNNAKVFLIKPLPFNNELKPLPSSEESEEAHSVEETKIVNQIIDKLSIEYDVKMYVHPQKAKKKAFLRAKLLGVEQEEVEDVTANNAKEVDEHLEGVLEEFKSIFHWENEAPGRKRKGAAATAGAKKKK